MFKRQSLRLRIFLSMLLLVLLASVLIVSVTVYQYREETTDYHEQRLERKEKNIKQHINFVIKQTSFQQTTDKIPFIFKQKIYELAHIHNLQINLYDLEGNLLISSKASITPLETQQCIASNVLNTLMHTTQHRFVEKRLENDIIYQSSYSFINNTKSKPIAILNLPYLEDDDFLSKELDEFLERIGYAYLFMFLLAMGLAYILSKFITKSLKEISDKLNVTRLERTNEKIQLSGASEEITTLINSYNSMVDELEESAVKLATSERENAWREMAKQVAHEIKNPLTPMRLSVQSFQRKFDADDPEIEQKVTEFSDTLIQQIDTMSSIASAFSSFARMPEQNSEPLNVVQVVKMALDIFSESEIELITETDEVIANFDRTQLIRIVTNLITNAHQATSTVEAPKIQVTITQNDANVNVIVADNGVGISDENKHKIFEPKFTTKSSGMGLGLAMIKNIVETYNGSITFTSQHGKGSVFTISFPKH